MQITEGGSNLVEQQIKKAQDYIDTYYPVDPDHIKTLALESSESEEKRQYYLGSQFEEVLIGRAQQGFGDPHSPDYLPTMIKVRKKLETTHEVISPLNVVSQLDALITGEKADYSRYHHELQKYIETAEPICLSYFSGEEGMPLAGHSERIDTLEMYRETILQYMKMHPN